jgi:hypothetical protein
VGEGAILADQSGGPHRYYPVAVLARLSPRIIGTVEAFVMSFSRARIKKKTRTLIESRDLSQLLNP